jgi:hypothetical protein
VEGMPFPLHDMIEKPVQNILPEGSLLIPFIGQLEPCFEVIEKKPVSDQSYGLLVFGS